MYIVLLTGEIKKELDLNKLKHYASIGFFVTSNYCDAVAYSRALLLRGCIGVKTSKEYYKSDDIIIN